MKKIMVFLMVVSTNAFAQFQPMKVCGDRALVIDRRDEVITVDRAGNREHRTYYQLVLKDRNIIQDFISKGALDSHIINRKGEFIANLVKNESGQFYGMFDKGRTVTVELYPHAAQLNVYSPSITGSRHLANFYFNYCN